MKANLAWLMTHHMLTPTILAAFTLSMLFVFNARAADPQVSNVQASQRTGTKLVDITYDVTAVGAVTVSAAVSTNRGVTYDLPATHFSGSGYGSGVTPGTGKAIVWDAGADWDGQYNMQMRVKVTANDGSNPSLPPDPVDVANAPSNGVVSLMYDNVSFLFTGTNLVQTGVAAGTINALRVAVLRGRVLNQSREPLSGVAVVVNNHPEFGQTLTRTNGMYDLAVNGGQVLNLNYTKSGYLTVQRTFDMPWQDYVPADDVVLTVADTNVTVIGLTSATQALLGLMDAGEDDMQVAMGGVISDADGTRRLVVMFPTELTASIITSGGVTQLVDTLTTRFTEYTAGSNGPSAMPGDLPSQVAYTYAVDLGAEEAQAKVAGKDVLFNTNVICYLDNFLGMPEGGGVPSAYYDRDHGAWVPDTDGLVVRLLGTNAAGLAKISGSTNGVEINYTEWGITDSERRKLAEVYQPATNSLWRIPIRHFSSFDWNYGVGNTEAEEPELDLDEAEEPEYDESEWLEGYGSLDIENRVFREAFPVAGTPFALCYSSDQAPDTLNIPLTEATYPAALQRVDLKIGIAGTNYSYSFSPSANLSYNFTWNDPDVYGRELFGKQPVSVEIGYAYKGYYLQPRTGTTKSNWVSFGYAPGYVLTDIPSRRDYIMWQSKNFTISHRPPQQVGGWSLNVHHIYDPVGKKIIYGTGSTRSAAQLDNNTPVISTLAGTNGGGFMPGQPAKQQTFDIINDVVAAADGTYYFSTGNCVVQVDTNDLAWIYAGHSTSGDSGNAVPALGAYFNTVRGLVFGSYAVEVVSTAAQPAGIAHYLPVHSVRRHGGTHERGAGPVEVGGFAAVKHGQGGRQQHTFVPGKVEFSGAGRPQDLQQVREERKRLALKPVPAAGKFEKPVKIFHSINVRGLHRDAFSQGEPDIITPFGRHRGEQLVVGPGNIHEQRRGGDQVERRARKFFKTTRQFALQQRLQPGKRGSGLHCHFGKPELQEFEALSGLGRIFPGKHRPVRQVKGGQAGPDRIDQRAASQFVAVKNAEPRHGLPLSGLELRPVPGLHKTAFRSAFHKLLPGGFMAER